MWSLVLLFLKKAFSFPPLWMAIMGLLDVLVPMWFPQLPISVWTNIRLVIAALLAAAGISLGYRAARIVLRERARHKAPFVSPSR